MRSSSAGLVGTCEDTTDAGADSTGRAAGVYALQEKGVKRQCTILARDTHRRRCWTGCSRHRRWTGRCRWRRWSRSRCITPILLGRIPRRGRLHRRRNRRTKHGSRRRRPGGLRGRRGRRGTGATGRWRHASQRGHVGPADRGVAGAHGRDGLPLAWFFIVGSVFRTRCRFDALHDECGRDIGLRGAKGDQERVSNTVGRQIRTSFRALMTTCVPRRNLATALECVWKSPFLASGTPSPHQLIWTNLGSLLCVSKRRLSHVQQYRHGTKHTHLDRSLWRTRIESYRSEPVSARQAMAHINITHLPSENSSCSSSNPPSPVDCTLR